MDARQLDLESTNGSISGANHATTHGAASNYAAAHNATAHVVGAHYQIPSALHNVPVNTSVGASSTLVKNPSKKVKREESKGGKGLGRGVGNSD